ncbi:MAG: winged helix-turn-helix domain-containing protein [Oligoflexia bacterium]|nr:winged helix-turn-helix domain-containing protein [Oligoflexia bacterium]
MSLPLAQEYNYEMGRLYYDRAEYSKALERFEKACALFIENKQYDRYVDALNYVLRILVEREELQKIQNAKESLQDLVVREGYELSSRTHYILGLCSYYRDGQESVSMDYFQKALKIALDKDNKVDMCYAIYGIANSYYSTGKLEEALKELYNLEVFFGALQVPDLQVSSRLLNGLIHRNRGEYDRAIECFWQAYEMLKTNSNMLLYYNALYGLGSTFQRSGDVQLARLYLQLALRSVNETELPRMTRLLKGALAELGHQTENRDFDLVFEPESNSVVERSLGRVNFKNQFILIDLLHLFLKNPGRVFPKEVLVRKVWDQEYDPTIHDNKIYVTIKRLRQLIEPDFNKPKYIFRGKNGYYLNKSARVLVGH